MNEVPRVPMTSDDPTRAMRPAAARELPLKAYLRRLIWLCMLPLVLLALYLAYDSVHKIRAAEDLASELLAGQIVSSIDATLQARIDALHALAVSPLLNRPQLLEPFHIAAQSLRRTFAGEVVLADRDGRMLIHTGRPFGSALPSLPRPATHAAAPEALATGRPAVGDSFDGVLADTRLVAVAVPVGASAPHQQVLLVALETQQLQQVVDQVSLPAGWSVSLLDGANQTLASRRSTPQGLQSGADGGERRVVKSRLSPWSVVLVGSAASQMAPVLAAAEALAIAILGATLIGLMAGTLASRRLARSVASLVRDEAPPTPEIAEIAAVRRRLDEATRQREAADASKQAIEAESRVMLELISDAFIFVDAQRRIRRVNPAFETLFGYSAEEAIGRTTEFLYADPADFAAQGRLRFQAQPQGPRANAPSELHLRHKEGRELWTELIGRSIVAPDGTVLGSFGLHRDITAQKRARLELERERQQTEAALRSRDLRLTGLIESAMDAIVSVNDQHRIVLFNAAAEAMFGYRAEAVMGQRLDLLIPHRHRPGHDQKVEAFQRTGVTARHMGSLGQVSGLRADGTEFPAEASISQLRLDGETIFTVIVRDLSERMHAEQARAKLETQLLQAQKMEALGTLAGGIAHDFNNILSAIGGNVELARLEAGGDPALQHKLEQIGRATRRAGDLVRQILTFSRRQPMERVVVDLRDVVLEAVRLLRSTLPAGIELVTTLSPDAPPVLADRTQLHQVLMNLVVNAAQAIGSKPGRIEVSLAGLDADLGIAAPIPGRCVRLSIVDNGPGMDAATRQRIFDPFFTTKPVGEGTGLGLAVVDGIVKRFGGSISVYTEPGRGCAFHLVFPATVATDAEGVVAQPESAARAGRAGGSQRVLYLDDDEALVMVGQAMLERLGYRAQGHTDAGQALAAFEADPQGFDALISDFNMPGQSGLDIAERVRCVRPDRPVVLASGLITDELLLQARALGVREVLYKPHSLDDLAAALHRLLAASAEPPTGIRPPPPGSRSTP